MKKPILAAALALAMAAGAAPAHAGQTQSTDDWTDAQAASWSSYGNSFVCIPVALLMGLLVPAVQSARL